MTELVQDILDLLKSSVALKNEEDKAKKFAIRISFDCSIGDFNVDVVGHGEEVIYEDLERTMDKDLFISQIIHELLTFSLINIHVEITLWDIEERQTLFYTKSCSKFREKVVDLTTCNLSAMREVLIPDFNAELYFYVALLTNRATNFFITNDYANTAATNTMHCHLAQNDGLDGVSFMCRTTEENHNNVKKCIERAMARIHDHFVRVKGILPEPGESQVPSQTPKSSKDFVDLTEHDSDDENCHDRQLREYDEEYRMEYFTQDPELDTETAKDEIKNNETFNNWMIELGENLLLKNEELEEEIKRIDQEDMNFIADGKELVPKKIPNWFENFRPEIFSENFLPQLEQTDMEVDDFPIKQEKKPKKPLTYSSSAPPQSKLSFSGAHHPRLRDPAIPMVEPHHEKPSYKFFEPRLNRGSTANVSLGNVTQRRKDPSKIPHSNLLGKAEVQKYYDQKKQSNSERRLPGILEKEKEVRKKFDNFSIPKLPSISNVSSQRNVSGSVLENDYEPVGGLDPSQGARPRRKLHDNSHNQSQSRGGVAKYTDSVRKVSDPNLMGKFVGRMQNLKPIMDSPVSKQAENRTPPSVKVFFDESKFEIYQKNPKKENTDENSITQPIPVDTSDDDDDVVMVDDKQLDENKNIQTSKRSRSMYKEERDKNHAGKFKDENRTSRYPKRDRDRSHDVQNFSSIRPSNSKIPKSENDNSRAFWDRHNDN